MKRENSFLSHFGEYFLFGIVFLMGAFVFLEEFVISKDASFDNMMMSAFSFLLMVFAIMGMRLVYLQDFPWKKTRVLKFFFGVTIFALLFIMFVISPSI